MGNVRLYGSTSGYTELAPPAIAPDGVLTLPSGTGTLATAAYVDAAVAAGGKVLQVVSATKSDTFTLTSTSYIDITGLSVSITPSSATSEVYVMVTVTGNGNPPSTGLFLQLVRNSTAIAIPTSPGSRNAGFGGLYSTEAALNQTTSTNFLDSPGTTSVTTYKVQGKVTASTGFINRGSTDTDSSGFIRTVSSITVMEISA